MITEIELMIKSRRKTNQIHEYYQIYEYNQMIKHTNQIHLIIIRIHSRCISP